MYDGAIKELLKIYRWMDLDGKKEVIVVIKKYNLEVPWQMIGKNKKLDKVEGGHGSHMLVI